MARETKVTEVPASETDIERRFSFHPATDRETQQAHEAVRVICKNAVYDLLQYVPEGRERSQMISAVEQAMMYGNAGIARAGA